MDMPFRRCPTAVLAALTIACAAPDEALVISSPPEPGTTVTNREPAWTRSTRWTMGRSPAIEIGGGGANAANALLKVAGVVRLDDGTVVVANASSGELRYFDRTGEHITTSGGIGIGRATFRAMGWLQPLETGGLAVYDESLRSLSVFDEEGNYVRGLLGGYDPRSNGAFLTIVGVFDDESVLIHQSRLSAQTEGAQRSDDWFVRAPRMGVPATVTGAFPGEEIVRRNFINSRDVARPPFGRSLHAAIAPDRFYVGDDDSFTVSAFSPDGTLLHVVRLDSAERAVTEDAIDEFVEVRMAPHPLLDRSVLEPPLRAMVTHATMPAFSALRSDPDGTLWALDFSIALPEDRQERWNVFDPNGRYLGALEMPTGFTSMTVGVDYVAGVAKNKFGTEYARVYDLEKPRRR